MNLRDAPELGTSRNRVAGLQYEAGRSGADIAQLYDLDRSVGIQAEALDEVAVRQFEVADFQGDPATDFDNRLVGEAQSLQSDATGNFDEEHLANGGAALAWVFLLERGDNLEGFLGILTWIAIHVGPVVAIKRDHDRALNELAFEVVAINRFVGLIDDAIAVIVDAIEIAGDERGRSDHFDRAFRIVQSVARKRDFIAIDGRLVEGNASRSAETDVNPGETGSIRNGQGGAIGRRIAGRIQRVVTIGDRFDRNCWIRIRIVGAIVPVAEGIVLPILLDKGGRLALIQNDLIVAWRRNREFGLEIGDAIDIERRACRHRVGYVDVTAVIEKIRIRARIHDRIRQGSFKDDDGEGLAEDQHTHAIRFIGIDRIACRAGERCVGDEVDGRFAAAEVAYQEVAESAAIGQLERSEFAREAYASSCATQAEFIVAIENAREVELASRDGLEIDIQIAEVRRGWIGYGQRIRCGATRSIGRRYRIREQGHGQRSAGIGSQSEVAEGVGSIRVVDQYRRLRVVQSQGVTRAFVDIEFRFEIVNRLQIWRKALWEAEGDVDESAIVNRCQADCPIRLRSSDRRSRSHKREALGGGAIGFT